MESAKASHEALVASMSADEKDLWEKAFSDADSLVSLGRYAPCYLSTSASNPPSTPPSSPLASPMASSSASEATRGSSLDEFYPNEIEYTHKQSHPHYVLRFPIYPSDRHLPIWELIQKRVCDVVGSWTERHEYGTDPHHYVLKIDGVEANAYRFVSEFVLSNHLLYENYDLEYYPPFFLDIKFFYGNNDGCECYNTTYEVHGTTDIWEIEYDLGNDLGDRVPLSNIVFFYKGVRRGSSHQLRHIFEDDLTVPSPFKRYELSAYMAYILENDSVPMPPINYILYEDHAYPFETHKVPLYPSNLECSKWKLKKDAIAFLCAQGVLNDTCGRNYEIKFKNIADNVWDENTEIYLVYLPRFDISVKLEFEEGVRETFTMRQQNDFEDLLDNIVRGRGGLEPTDLRVFYKGEEQTCLDTKFRDVFENIGWAYAFHEVVVKLRGRGGGKRGRSTASSSNQTKDDYIRNLDDEVGTALLRINAVQNASPAIELSKQALVQLMAFAKNEDFQPAELLTHFGMNELKETLSVSSSVAKADAKCRNMVKVLFGNCLRQLEEVERQTALMKDALRMAINYYFLVKYSDESGNIQWTSAFNGDVAKAMEELAKKNNQQNAQQPNGQNAHPRNGLGM